MSENKTKPEAIDPQAFLATIAKQQRREDGEILLQLMTDETGLPAVMWGPSMIGFGQYHYRYDSGREGDFFITGFSPRAGAISLYVYGPLEQHAESLARLGKHKTGKSCIYINRLSDVDLDAIRQLIRTSFALADAERP